MLLAHELEHCYGYDHEDMGELAGHRWKDWHALIPEYDWAVEKLKGDEFLPVVECRE
jgi:hypothetical protein